jgi:hypothetical protein
MKTASNLVFAAAFSVVVVVLIHLGILLVNWGIVFIRGNLATFDAFLGVILFLMFFYFLTEGEK